MKICPKLLTTFLLCNGSVILALKNLLESQFMLSDSILVFIDGLAISSTVVGMIYLIYQFIHNKNRNIKCFKL